MLLPDATLIWQYRPAKSDEASNESAPTVAGSADSAFEAALALRRAQLIDLLQHRRETPRLEFKSSFAWDVRKDEPGDYLKKECWIAICALLNADGGDLVIGVDDDANVLGLERDISKAKNLDALIRQIESGNGTKLTPNPIRLIEIHPVEIDSRTILHVRVKADCTQIYEFESQVFVRRNAASKPALTPTETALWWLRRQRGEV